jgi:hypothetical protein
MINKITTNRGGPVTYSWGIDAHENNNYLGEEVGSLVSRQYDNLFVQFMRINNLDYIQFSKDYQPY